MGGNGTSNIDLSREESLPKQLTFLQYQMKSQQEREQQHQREVKTAFFNYQKDMRETMAPFFSDQQLPKYYELVRERKKQQLEKAITANQHFLNCILQSTEGEFTPEEQTACNNVPKIRTTIKQFFREWCGQSEEVKDYLMLVDKAQKYLNKGSRLLVPGSGLGRLVLELVEIGFKTQGNQVTYFMLYSSNFILNCVFEEETFEIYPFIHSTSNYDSEELMFRAVTIPDKVACKVVSEESDFSMAAGEFTEIYQDDKEEFDGIVTCFFLDTANNVFNYIDTIGYILKRGGIWINYGPLLYHFKGVQGEISVEISWEQLRAYMQTKFTILEEEQIETTYCHDPKSTYKPIYKCMMTVCRRNQ